MTETTKLQSISNQLLLTQTKMLVEKERNVTTAILGHLLEIESRRLFADRGYSSLHQFVVKELGYCDAGAHRRIASMRFVKDLPEAQAAIEKGTLCLSTAATLQNFFRCEKRVQNKEYSRAEKLEIMNRVAGLSRRKVERHLAEISPKSVSPQDKERHLSASKIHISFVTEEEVLQKLNRVCELEGRKLGYAELIEMLADFMIERVDPRKKAERAQIRYEKRKLKESENVAQKIDFDTKKDDQKSRITFPGKLQSHIECITKPNRYIDAKTRHSLWKKGGEGCAFIDSMTRRRCGSKYGLQIDHQIPLALGGTSEISNLRLLCAAHNQWEAISVFGRQKMKTHIPGL